MPITYEITRIRLDAGGYTATGAYYGTGAPLFYFQSECETHSGWMRARNRWDLRRKLRARYPDAKFIPARAS